MLNVGDRIPEVLGKNEKGEVISRSQFAGKKLVLYFYPKDNTSGCTAEACSLRDNCEALEVNGYTIIGVSTDSEKSHQNFISKHSLPFTLIADTDTELHNTFGTWGEKSMCGRKYMGTLRTTYLINEEGIITKIFSPKEIKTKVHGEQILKAIEAL